MPGILDIIGGPVSALINGVKDLLGKKLQNDADKVEAYTALAALEQQVTVKAMEAETTFAELQSRVILAEAQGSSWMQRNWRPVLMLTFTGILANNFILAPYFSALTHGAIKVLEFPTAFWGLLTVGVGGYIAGRTFEKKWEVDGTHTGNGG